MGAIPATGNFNFPANAAPNSIMIATCPNNPDHKKFTTTAHVSETWLVDEYGNFLEGLGGGETTHKPDPDNIWTCHECGAEAKVES